MLTNEERAEGELREWDRDDIPVELRKATKQFLEELGRVPLNASNGVIPWKSAVKFLMARKFDVRRAVDLYVEHEKTRRREGIEGPDLRDPEIRRELLTQKFTVLPGRDKSGAAIALFQARYHHPEQTSHQATLQGLIFQLDAALESIETQRYGLVFVYDMTGSRYSNFDYDLSIKILNLLKGSYPARLKKVLIVTAPLWFKAPFRFLRLFVREKLRERVYTVDLSQLCHHIPSSVLPQYLGGKVEFSHRAWLEACLQQTWGSGTENEITAYLEGTDNFRLTNDTSMSSISSCDDDFGGVGGATFSSDPESSQSSRSTINEKHNHEYREKEVILPSGANMDTSDDDQSSSASANSPAKNGTSQLSRKRNLHGSAVVASELIGDVPPPLPRKKCNLVVSAHEPIHVPDENGLTIDELVKYCKIKGRRGLYKEYAYVKLEPPTGTFEASKSKPNLPKNRYTDVLCLDQTRVTLNIVNGDNYSDYINANFLDGYKQKNAYISTQGPLPRTFGDFWRMVWEQMVLLVVMTTKTVERGRLKCGQYWPADKDSIDTYDDFVVINTGVTENTEYTVTTLILQNSKTGETREIRHLQFTSWPDYGVPDSARAFLDFMHLVRDTQAERVKELGSHWTGNARGPPIVIHCSAGIGRTGTFITMDISTQRLADIHTVDIRNTVRRIRTQRAFSIQMPDQYIFCHLALIEHAQSLGLLSEVDLDGFDDESSEDD